MSMIKFRRFSSSCAFYVRNLVSFGGGERNRLVPKSPLRGYSSSSAEQEQDVPHAFPKSYLINSCGLPPEIAISAAKKLKFQTPENPDLVLALLRDHGFDDTHISKLIRNYPKVLLSDPEKFLCPKLEFFRNVMGLSKMQLGDILCLIPHVFIVSLQNRIIPCYEFLKSVLLDDTKVAIALRRGSYMLRNDVHQYVSPNLKMLRQVGAPHSVISYSLCHYPWMYNQKHDKFSSGVEDVINMGFQISQLSFVNALNAITLTSKSKWERNVNIFKSWGWSDDDISMAFRKNPICILFSEKKITTVMDFLVNKMGLPTSYIAKSPTILTYSLEKRIVPRSRVYRILHLQGLMEKETSLYCFITPAEEQFLDKFVSPYIEQVPDLLNIYKGQMGLSQLDF